MLVVLVALLLSGCAVARSPQVVRVALLGPFEGRYREVGYNALYAVRLALSEGSDPQPNLLAIDDGGSVTSAVARAEALTLDPTVRAVIAVGYDAADPATQAALGDVPMIIPGNWTDTVTRPNVFLLGDPALAQALTVPATISVIDAASAPSPLVGGDVLALAQFPRLRDSLADITLLSNGQRPTEAFAERYSAGNPFAPEPNVLAMLTYDATVLAVHAVMQSSNAAEALAAADFDGLSGHIAFANGVWRDAPQYAYRFDADGALVAVEDLIEQR